MTQLRQFVTVLTSSTVVAACAGAVVLSAGALVACDRERTTTSEQTEGEPGAPGMEQPGQPGMEQPGQPGMEQAQTDREEFIDEANRRLERIDAEIQAMEEEMATAGDEARTRWQQAMTTLREERQQAVETIERARQATAEEWQQMRQDARAALDDVERAYNRALSALQTQP